MGWIEVMGGMGVGLVLGIVIFGTVVVRFVQRHDEMAGKDRKEVQKKWEDLVNELEEYREKENRKIT